MALTVADLVDRARRILQETTPDGTRWTNDELAGWLNEFYPAAVALRPAASSVNAELTLTPGTKQTLPTGGVRLLDVIRNTVGTMGAVFVTARKTLDTLRRHWHGDDASTEIEQFVFDDLDPTTFYVYPPAASGAAVEILYVTVPAPHDLSAGYATYGLQAFQLDDLYGPAAVDYLLFRAFSKDAETGAYLNRAQLHAGQFRALMTGQAQTDQMASPNSPDTSANPPRG